MVELATAPATEEANRPTARPDGAATAHLLISTGFLALAGLLTVLSLATLVFPAAALAGVALLLRRFVQRAR